MTLKEAIRAAGKDYLERLMVECRGKMEVAAMEAGISRQALYKLAPRYGVALATRPYNRKSKAT